MGVAQELQTQRRPAAADRSRSQPGGGLARPAPLERHPRLDHRPRGPPVPQVEQHRGPAVLRRAPADGAPQRVDRRRRAHPGDGLRRAGRRDGDAGPAPQSRRRRTVAGDKGYDTKDFVARARGSGSPPTSRRTPPTGAPRSMGAPPATAGHAASQRIRKRIEEPFGWVKTIAGGRKLRYIGQARNRAWFLLTAAVYNILRITALDSASRRLNHPGATPAKGRPRGASPIPSALRPAAPIRTRTPADPPEAELQHPASPSAVGVRGVQSALASVVLATFRKPRPSQQSPGSPRPPKRPRPKRASPRRPPRSGGEQARQAQQPQRPGRRKERSSKKAGTLRSRPGRPLRARSMPSAKTALSVAQHSSASQLTPHTAATGGRRPHSERRTCQTRGLKT